MVLRMMNGKHSSEKVEEAFMDAVDRVDDLRWMQAKNFKYIEDT